MTVVADDLAIALALYPVAGRVHPAPGRRAIELTLPLALALLRQALPSRPRFY